MKIKHLFLLTSILFSIISCTIKNENAADIALKNAEIYTMEENTPWAKALAMKGKKIIAVVQNTKEIDKYIGNKTKVIDLHGQFVVPGFIDAHTHFGGFGARLNGPSLYTVSDNEGLKKEIARVVEVIPEGEWITGGVWGAYEEWSFGAEKADNKKKGRWEPDRSVIDDITPNHFCLLSSYDNKLYLANTAALKAAGLENAKLKGMKLKNGKPTGLLYAGSPAIDKIKALVKPKSEERILNEMRAGLKELARRGIVEIHDITDEGYPERYAQLEKNGELTCRVWMRPDLSRGAEMKEKGITMGVHPVTGKKDHFLRYGAFKGYIDGVVGSHGALFFEPYSDQPDNYGHYRRHTSDDPPEFKKGNMQKMYDLIKTGIDAGFVTNVHAIGTKGNSLMLDTYEQLKKDMGKDLDRFRIIHAQTIRPEDFPRFKVLNVIAEVNPYHLSDDMRWMEERIGYERCKTTYAFKSLIDNGAKLTFGSDIPGTGAAIYLCHPKYLIHAAVNRTTLMGKPEGGWFPEQKISVNEALKAYTINAAYATFDENIRGSIKAGKLADITVCDKNLMKINPEEILDMDIVMTIVDGKIVFKNRFYGFRIRN